MPPGGGVTADGLVLAMAISGENMPRGTDQLGGVIITINISSGPRQFATCQPVNLRSSRHAKWSMREVVTYVIRRGISMSRAKQSDSMTNPSTADTRRRVNVGLTS